jgi:glycosyltransferase involved in cell wall biosynthesis
MRLIYPDPNWVPDTTPSALQILQNVDAFGQLGIDLCLLTPKSRNGLSPENMLGRSLPPSITTKKITDLRRRWFFPSSSNKAFYFLATRWISQQRECILLVRNLKMAEYLLRAGLRHSLFFETHEVFAQTFREEKNPMSAADEKKLSALAAREAFVYRNCKGVIALTKHLADDIRNQYGITTPIHIAPDGFDAELSARSVTANSNSRPILLYLGSLHPWKGVDMLVRVMRYVKGARLRIVGGVPERISQLRSLAKSMGLDQQIEFLGPVDPIKRFDIIAEADICLLPSSNTSIGSRFTSPLKLFEYMAMGKPIVTSNLPAIREVLTNSENALLVDFGDEEKFASAINLLLSSPELQLRLGTNAKALSRRYTWKARVQNILDFMRQVAPAQ